MRTDEQLLHPLNFGRNVLLHVAVTLGEICGMLVVDLRADRQTRGVVDEAISLFRLKGATVAVAYLYRFGVATSVIERIISREKSLSEAELHSRGKVGPVLLSDVLATYRLALREPRLPRSSQELNRWPPLDQTLHGLLESARLATGADSVGVSVFNENMDELTWVDIVGELAHHKGQSIPRRNSMCDVCFQTAQAQLFITPHRFFEWMAPAGLLVNEALVTPIRGGSQFYFGTLWAVVNSGSATEFTSAHLGALKLHSLAVRSALEMTDTTQAK